MKKYIPKFVKIFLLIFLPFYCKNYKDSDHIVKEEITSTKTPAIAIKNPSPRWEPFSKFIAGEIQNINNPYLKQFTEKEWYLKYQKKIEQHTNIFKQKETVIKNWIEQNIPETKNFQNVIYLLSGADFYYLYLFFPKAKNYVMVAMEKSGELFEYEKMNEAEIKNSLNAIEQVIHNLVVSGYFFSRTMDQFLNKDKIYKIYGTLPIVLYFLHYFDWKVEDISEFCNLEQNQVCLEKGYHIKIFKNQEEANIYYLSKKLLPIDINKESSFIKFLDQFPKERSLFLKSAVYLFHYGTFQNYANYLSNQFDSIIQDDSGIPFAIMKKNDFQFKLFGEYIDTPPLKETIHPLQEELVKEYKQKSLGKLPFEFGYGLARGNRKSNIIFAYK